MGCREQEAERPALARHVAPPVLPWPAASFKGRTPHRQLSTHQQDYVIQITNAQVSIVTDKLREPGFAFSKVVMDNRVQDEETRIDASANKAGGFSAAEGRASAHRPRLQDADNPAWARRIGEKPE
jgi:hypothetical protein